jgi:hypothetical protein
LRPSLTVNATPATDPGRYDVLLTNDGDADMSLPPLIRIGGACAYADGINGYELQRGERGLFLQRSRVGILRAGRRLAVGWVRCDGAPSVHAEL